MTPRKFEPVCTTRVRVDSDIMATNCHPSELYTEGLLVSLTRPINPNSFTESFHIPPLHCGSTKENDWVPWRVAHARIRGHWSGGWWLSRAGWAGRASRKSHRLVTHLSRFTIRTVTGMAPQPGRRWAGASRRRRPAGSLRRRLEKARETFPLLTLGDLVGTAARITKTPRECGLLSGGDLEAKSLPFADSRVIGIPTKRLRLSIFQINEF